VTAVALIPFSVFFMCRVLTTTPPLYFFVVPVLVRYIPLRTELCTGYNPPGAAPVCSAPRGTPCCSPSHVSHFAAPFVPRTLFIGSLPPPSIHMQATFFCLVTSALLFWANAGVRFWVAPGLFLPLCTLPVCRFVQGVPLLCPPPSDFYYYAVTCPIPPLRRCVVASRRSYASPSLRSLLSCFERVDTIFCTPAVSETSFFSRLFPSGLCSVALSPSRLCPWLPHGRLSWERTTLCSPAHQIAFLGRHCAVATPPS